MVLDLVWQRRDQNQAADDLTNEEFSAFSESHRITFALSDLDWVILPELYKEALGLHEVLHEAKLKEASRAIPRAEHKFRKIKRRGLKVTDPW